MVQSIGCLEECDSYLVRFQKLLLWNAFSICLIMDVNFASSQCQCSCWNSICQVKCFVYIFKMQISLVYFCFLLLFMFFTSMNLHITCLSRETNFNDRVVILYSCR